MVSKALARRRLEGGPIPLCSDSPFCEAAAVAAAAAAGASDWVSGSGTGANQRGQRTGGARHGEYEEPISSGPEPAPAPRLAGLADHSGEAQASVEPGSRAEAAGAGEPAAPARSPWRPTGAVQRRDGAPGPGSSESGSAPGARGRCAAAPCCSGTGRAAGQAAGRGPWRSPRVVPASSSDLSLCPHVPGPGEARVPGAPRQSGRQIRSEARRGRAAQPARPTPGPLARPPRPSSRPAIPGLRPGAVTTPFCSSFPLLPPRSAGDAGTPPCWSLPKRSSSFRWVFGTSVLQD